MKERATARVLFVVLGEALLDVCQPCADAVLMSLERREVDGVGKVCGQQLVTLGFEACPVRGEVGELLIPPGTALVERGIDLRREMPVVGFADRDRGVGVLDEPFRNLHRHRATGAVRPLRCTAGTDEVGVGRAAWIGREVEQHP
nr:hypothetical protein [Tessaracoccus defluvii]